MCRDSGWVLGDVVCMQMDEIMWKVISGALLEREIEARRFPIKGKLSLLRPRSFDEDSIPIVTHSSNILISLHETRLNRWASGPNAAPKVSWVKIRLRDRAQHDRPSENLPHRHRYSLLSNEYSSRATHNLLALMRNFLHSSDLNEPSNSISSFQMTFEASSTEIVFHSTHPPALSPEALIISSHLPFFPFVLFLCEL